MPGIDIGPFQMVTAVGFDFTVASFGTNSGGSQTCRISFDSSLRDTVDANLFGVYYFPRADVTFTIQNSLYFFDTGYNPHVKFVFSDYSGYSDPPGGFPYTQVGFSCDFYVSYFNMDGTADPTAPLITLSDDNNSGDPSRFEDLGIEVGDQVIYTN